MKFKPGIDQFTDLDLEFADMQTARAVVEHEFAGRNGVLTEDMGGKARRFTFVVWFGVRQSSNYEDHAPFYQHLDSNRLVTFTHPEYGPIKGKVVTLGERRQDEEEAVGIDVSFVEEAISDATPQAFVDIRGACESAYAASIEEQKALFAVNAHAAIGAVSADILSVDLDAEASVLSQYANVTGAVRTWINGVDVFVRKIEAAMTTVQQPANSIMNMVSFGATLSDRVIGSAARAVERYVVSLSGLIASPYRFAYSFYSSMQSLIDSVTSFKDVFTYAAASRGALEMAISYDADEQNRDIMRELEKTLSFDLTGRRLTKVDFPPLVTVNDLEASLALCRSWIQRVVDVSREESVALKRMASELAGHVRTQKIERERLTEIVVDPWMPIHLLCHKRGLSYRHAERILAINSHITNPTFTQGRTRVFS